MSDALLGGGIGMAAGLAGLGLWGAVPALVMAPVIASTTVLLPILADRHPVHSLFPESWRRPLARITRLDHNVRLMGLLAIGGVALAFTGTLPAIAAVGAVSALSSAAIGGALGAIKGHFSADEAIAKAEAEHIAFSERQQMRQQRIHAMSQSWSPQTPVHNAEKHELRHEEQEMTFQKLLLQERDKQSNARNR